MDDSNILITGGNGQLGTALKAKYPNAAATDTKDLDISNYQSVKNFDWSNISIILNAAGYTNVDGAETTEGRVAAWKVNAQALSNLVKIAFEKELLIVHVSTDYVFDGTQSPHTEAEQLSPLSIYGASKAAGDLILGTYPEYYLLRTSWVIGEGKNFVRTMLELGNKGISPKVVSDQIGRPTFTNQLVNAIDWLLKNKPIYGTYNVSNSGDPVSWADLTRAIYKEAGLSNQVTDTTTAEYYKDKPNIAPRPLNSIFDLSKIESTGFKPNDWREDLQNYVKEEIAE